ncbi:MAG: type II toxin-antitoxin system prevent-host-death family antitoxin [Desulfobacca sp.]|nr:type II toxin-antitoxin system prevent-host-death family antitoxin [Desulfobacca sp.]
MTIMVNIHEAKTNLSRLLARVSDGEEVILAKAGKPIARLVSCEETRPRQPGMVKGHFDDRFFDPLPEDEIQAWGQ